jgi:hypothetical protein
MRRLVNVLLAGAVAAVVAVAAADALRAGDTPADRLRAHGVSGLLLVRDDACRLHAYRLPELEEERAPPAGGCTAFMAPGRLGLRRGELAWGAVGDGQTIVLHREELAALLGRDDIARVAWLGGRRYAVVVRSARAGDEQLALFEGRRLVSRSPAREYDLLRASAGGTYLAAGRTDVLVRVLDATGRPVARLAGARSIAWSPDERWAAVAQGEEVLVVPAGDPDADPIRLPIWARDLGWRE